MFKRGDVGNPTGVTGESGKPFREALRRALLRPEGKARAIALDQIATALIREALAGNVQAMKEIADRTDGRAMQAVEVTGKDGGPLGFIHLPAKGA